MVKKLKQEDLNKRIEANRKEASKKIVEGRRGRRKRSRVRTKGEREALDQIAVQRWKKVR